MVAHFRLLTLGAPLLLTAAGEVVPCRTRKHLALLIRLALEPGRKLGREYLVDLLWGDVPLARGRHSLSQATTVLRAMLGASSILTERSALGLAHGVVDVDVLGLEPNGDDIRGRFLEGLDLQGARGFAEWRDGRELRVRLWIRDYLVRQMEVGRRVGDYAMVERYALILDRLDSHSEDAARGLMEARAWVGDRSGALRVYCRIAKHLAEEVGSKPGAQLNRIAELLREGREAAPRPKRDGVPPREERRYEAETIIGRQQEFTILHDAWAEIRHRGARVIVVRGDAGIGKTTLANAFASSCQLEGGVIARAQAYDAERELPYAVLAELMRQLTLQRLIGGAEPEALAELSRLVPEICTVFPGVQPPVAWAPEIIPLRLADAFLKAVAAAADRHPVLLVVDDIHAADNASVAILHMLTRKLAGLRLVLLLNARTGTFLSKQAAQALVEDSAIEGLLVLDLEPLSLESATLLAERVAAKGRERWGRVPIESILRAGAGNPLALELLARQWALEGREPLVLRLESLDSIPAHHQTVPRAIHAILGRQTQSLDSRTRAVLNLAAVLGRRLGDLRLYEAIGFSQGEALFHLTQLLEARILRDVAGSLEFRNELVRAQIYLDVPSSLRIELHKRAAEILERQPSDDRQIHMEIAWHLIVARDFRRAVAFALVGADDSLKTGAPEEAERILRWLLKEGVSREQNAAISVLVADALIGQSKADEALPFLDRLLVDEGLEKPQLARAARLYATAMYLLNRNSSVKHSEMAVRAVHIARECGNDELLAHALFECGRAGVESGSETMVSSARDDLNRIVAERGEQAPAIAYHAHAFCSYYLLEVEEATQMARRAIEALSKDGPSAELALAWTGAGNCLNALCHLQESRSAYDTALQISRRIGDDSRVSILCSNLAASYLIGGDVGKALSFGEEGLAVGTRAPTQPVLLRALSNLVFVYLLAGQPDKARECYESLQSWMSEGRSWAITIDYCCESASIELALGNTAEALRLIHLAEESSRGRALSINPGILERLRVFREFHTQGDAPARELARQCMGRFGGRHTLAFLESAAALAWLDYKSEGAYSTEAREYLNLFEELGVPGKRSMLAIQGFLKCL
jgi:DNA-binding SARP family transcriptional activator/tetratricopeptide (TPR) repeat protein